MQLLSTIKRAVDNPYKVKQYLRGQKSMFYYKYNEDGYADYPGTVYMVVNSICNLKCKMCDVGQAQEDSQFWQNLIGPKMEMPLDKLQKIVDEVKGFDPLITFSSTEPTLWKNFIPAIRIVKKAGLRLKSATNGLLLPKLARQIVEEGLDHLFISVDGPQEAHNYIRGVPKSFEMIVEGIKKVQEAKKELGKTNPIIQINTTISEYNYDKIVATIDSLQGLGINEFTISHLNFVTEEMKSLHNQAWPQYLSTHSCISSSESNKVNPEVLYEQLEEVKRKYKHLTLAFVPDMNLEELKTYYGSPLQILEKHNKCFVPWKVVQILSNGEVIPLTRCFHLVFGNVYTENFKDIWNNEKYRQFRKDLRRMEAFPGCARCCGIFN